MQDLIIDNESLRHNLCARALNFLEVFAIDRYELDAVAQAFPEVARDIRRVAVRLAVRRAFIRYAKEVLLQRTGVKKSLTERAFVIAPNNSAFVPAVPHEPSSSSSLGMAATSEIRKELSRQASRQDEIIAQLAQLTQAVADIAQAKPSPAESL